MSLPIAGSTRRKYTAYALPIRPLGSEKSRRRHALGIHTRFETLLPRPRSWQVPETEAVTIRSSDASRSANARTLRLEEPLHRRTARLRTLGPAAEFLRSPLSMPREKSAARMASRQTACVSAAPWSCRRSRSRYQAPPHRIGENHLEFARSLPPPKPIPFADKT